MLTNTVQGPFDSDELRAGRLVRKTDKLEEAFQLGKLISEVGQEVARARSMFPAIYSPHEGLAIIREEYLEFEDEVWQHNLFKKRDHRPQMRTELIQLAAMCLRTILDTIDGQE
jgi:hypothetical protein